VHSLEDAPQFIEGRTSQLSLPKVQIIDAMVIAAGDRNFDLLPEYCVERRIKARLPCHRFSNENKMAKPALEPLRRELFTASGCTTGFLLPESAGGRSPATSLACVPGVILKYPTWKARRLSRKAGEN